MTRQHDPMVPWLMLLAFLGVVAVSFVIGFLLDNWITGLIIGIPLGVLAATLILSRRAERAAFAQIENQPGRLGRRAGHAEARLDRRRAARRRQPPHPGRRLPRHRPPRRRPRQRGPQHPGQAAARRRTQAPRPHPAQRHHPRDRERPRRGPGSDQPGRQEDDQAEERTDQDSRSAPSPSASPRSAAACPSPRASIPYKARPDRKAARGR